MAGELLWVQTTYLDPKLWRHTVRGTALDHAYTYLAFTWRSTNRRASSFKVLDAGCWL